MSTYVLVHGSWHSGESWDRVVRLLESSGHRALAPSLTGHGEKANLMSREVGLDTHVDDIVGLIEAEDLTDVLLVGHSYAGLVITAVAERVPGRIAHLVYVDALVPEDGENAVDVMPAVFQPLVDKVAGSDVDWLIPPPPASPAGIFGITNSDDIAWVTSTLSPQALRTWTQPVRIASRAARAIARTHIHCALHPRAADRRPVPAQQPNGDPSQVWTLESGHDCMIIAPRELTELLLDLSPEKKVDHSS